MSRRMNDLNKALVQKSTMLAIAVFRDTYGRPPSTKADQSKVFCAMRATVKIMRLSPDDETIRSLPEWIAEAYQDQEMNP